MTNPAPHLSAYEQAEVDRFGIHVLPTYWEREVPGFPLNRKHGLHVVDPVDGYYQLTPDALGELLMLAGFRPADEQGDE